MFSLDLRRTEIQIISSVWNRHASHATFCDKHLGIHMALFYFHVFLGFLRSNSCMQLKNPRCNEIRNMHAVNCKTQRHVMWSSFLTSSRNVMFFKLTFFYLENHLDIRQLVKTILVRLLKRVATNVHTLLLSRRLSAACLSIPWWQSYTRFPVMMNGTPS